ncbi:site-2 protease family protein [Paenibacillus sp. HB172176]|uniref:site-2 protease family protein n=1 Tax=Paenibacillus sp. HB172176 TaxID=2493690 RepID=UPI001439730E|nr:site-2 protease family protein [Paenibacillus sp. HB172176]
MDLQSFFRFPLEDLPFIVLALILCFTVHEFAHAFMAYKFGDDTAYKEGRVTLNPVSHLDFLGFFLILIAGFGWAKPVPVRASRFRKPRTMSIIVSAAGPISNFLLGMIGTLVLVYLINSGFIHVGMDRSTDAIYKFLGYFISYNFLLFVFNLIPLPPLDGYRIVSEFLPLRVRYKVEQNIHWGTIIFLMLVFIPHLREFTIDPILNLVNPLYRFALEFAQSIL